VETDISALAAQPSTGAGVPDGEGFTMVVSVDVNGQVEALESSEGAMIAAREIYHLHPTTTNARNSEAQITARAVILAHYLCKSKWNRVSEETKEGKGPQHTMLCT